MSIRRLSFALAWLLLSLSAITSSLEAQSPSYLVLNPRPGSYGAYSLKTGYTVAITVGSIGEGAFEHVMGVIDNNINLWDLFRDSNGRWYVGKDRDPAAYSTPHYMMQVWDPVSPCTSATPCQRDTVYVSFHPNGQIQLDELALLPDNTYSWQSGLLNYGLPLTTYQPGSPDPLVNDASALPNFAGNDGNAKILLGSVFYPNWAPTGAPTEQQYDSATIQRIAAWNAVLTNPGILQDQNSFVGVQLPTDDLPCTTGQFAAKVVQKGSGPTQDPTGTGQFWPGFVPTPCNTPSVPTGVSVVDSGGIVYVSWIAPASVGQTRPGYPPTIVSYNLTFTNGGTTKAYTATGTTFRTGTNDLASGSWTMQLQAVSDTGGGASVIVPLTIPTGSGDGTFPGPPGASLSSCAGEGGTCNGQAQSWIAYGAYGSFEFAQVPSSGQFSCSNGSFPVDPNIAASKSCYSYGNLPNGPLYRAQAIAAQGGTATLPGARLVSYGTDITRPIGGTFTCNADTFGWTATDDKPSCYLLSPEAGFSTPPQPPGFYFCSSYGGSCTIGNSPTFIGIGNQYPATGTQGWDTAAQAAKSTTIACKNGSAFPTRSTTVTGEVLSCGVNSGLNTPIYYSKCANEESTCYIGFPSSKPSPTIAFGDTDKALYTIQYFGTSNLNCGAGYCTLYCDRRNFYSDPDEGADKACYTYSTSATSGSSILLPNEEIDIQTQGVGSGYPVSRTETLTNDGTASLTITSASITSSSVAGEFTVSGCMSPVAVGATCTLTINDPSPASGGATATLQILSNSPTSPTLIPIVATAPATTFSLSSNSLYFGQINTQQSLTLTNIGSTSGTVSSLNFTGSNAADFPVVSDGCTGVSLSPKAGCSIVLNFSGLDESEGATLVITSNASNSPQSVSLAGSSE